MFCKFVLEVAVCFGNLFLASQKELFQDIPLSKTLWFFQKVPKGTQEELKGIVKALQGCLQGCPEPKERHQ